VRGSALTELLADHTTLRVGGPARRFVTATTADELVRVVSGCDASGEPVLVLGGGSNVLVGDAGFDGTVVHIATRGIDADAATAALTVAAGEPWDAAVAAAVARGWAGIEALSGIPGTAGATPVQNVGAYGQEIAQTVASVRAWDRRTGRETAFTAGECGFGYRTSRFKREPDRWLVLEVAFRLTPGASAPIRYAELAGRLGVAPGAQAPLADVRAAVLELRRGKGMVPDDADHDTWSAGSFFTNPALDAPAAAALPPDAPRYPADGGRIKTSAAWLIEHAGFGKGYGTPVASLSTKHVLALTNRGGATAADILALAVEVRDGVRRRFGVELIPEPVLVGVGWPAGVDSAALRGGVSVKSSRRMKGPHD